MRRIRSVAAFELVVGCGVLLWWGIALSAGEVPEVEAGERAIWFHFAAESIMAILLITAGVLLWRGLRPGLIVSSVALGSLAYSCLNSAGYFADTDGWAMVAMFAVLAAATAMSILVMIHESRDRWMPTVGERAGAPGEQTLVP